jgi:hypothetical protein
MGGAALSVSGCAHPLKRNWAAYRAAKQRGDYATAATYLAPDARIWFEKKEGPGHPLKPKGGPYKDWDKEFKSKSTREDVRVEGRALTYISSEINDFYRLIERELTKARVTYSFDDKHRIIGMVYQGLTPKDHRRPDRYDEFKEWTETHYPGALESAAMKIPRSPKRWRALLTEWRRDAGLPPIE